MASINIKITDDCWDLVLEYRDFISRGVNHWAIRSPHYFHANLRHFCDKNDYEKMSEKSEKRLSPKLRKFYPYTINFILLVFVLP